MEAFTYGALNLMLMDTQCDHNRIFLGGKGHLSNRVIRFISEFKGSVGWIELQSGVMYFVLNESFCYFYIIRFRQKFFSCFYGEFG